MAISKAITGDRVVVEESTARRSPYFPSPVNEEKVYGVKVGSPNVGLKDPLNFDYKTGSVEIVARKYICLKV